MSEVIAARYQTLFLRNYARSKLATDPLYAAVADRLRGIDLPIIDVGCGIGLMAAYLRERGFALPITGIDHDAMKIAEAQRAISSARFEVRDARDFDAKGACVLLLDVLHYLTDDDQMRVLAGAARADIVIIRDAIRDATWRYRATLIAEAFAVGIRWTKAERLNFPPRERITNAFEGFSAGVTPMWGSTPFNNYLFVFKRE